MAKITLIDDDVDITDGTAAILREEGHSVSVMNTTEGAVDVLSRNTPDLLILDVMFPENPAGGFDLARKIRHTPAIKDLPIILLTGVNQEFPMDFSAGDIDDDWMPVQVFMEKPARAPDLIANVARMLKQEA
ncbi:MAG: response regulator [Verrucomicrobia bacterium]|jgi:CheY-like chemotaxis protein|nr:response regulator [Verrucomicrobiota bacterium]MBT7065228.1 response regulator [Verrucomicrobiota bacterium]MBT7700609.1 response regulator [Verrucomicrobiota bacterium]